MKTLKSFEDLLEAYKQCGTKCRAVVVCPNDGHTESVVRKCATGGLVDLIVVLDGGETSEFRDFCRKFPDDRLLAVYCDDTASAAREGVKLVREGRAQVLMKGSLNTDVLLHAVIDKEGGNGLIAPGQIMSHVTLVEAPVYHKMLLFSDAAVIPEPNLDQFDAMVRYDCQVCRQIGIECPKIALIHFSEKINGRYGVTTDYKELITRAERGGYGAVEMAGPMDVKTACDLESAKIKKISSKVVGDADVLIMPNLEAGNTFYKTVSYFGKARMAGLVTGTIAPIVVASRADSAESKFYSLILACMASL